MAVPFLPDDEQVDDSALMLLNEINQSVERLRLCIRALQARDFTRENPRISSLHQTNAISGLWDTIRLMYNDRTSIVSAPQSSVNNVTVQSNNCRRRRTCSESSCCMLSKDDAVNDNDLESENRFWSYDNNFILPTDDIYSEDDPPPNRSKERNRDGNNEDTLFTKFVSSPMKSSIWTAVICVVGWYMFRAR